MEDRNSLRPSNTELKEDQFIPIQKRCFFDDVFGMCSQKIPEEYLEFFFKYVLAKKAQHKAARSNTKRMEMTEKDGLEGLRQFEEIENRTKVILRDKVPNIRMLENKRKKLMVSPIMNRSVDEKRKFNKISMAKDNPMIQNQEYQIKAFEMKKRKWTKDKKQKGVNRHTSRYETISWLMKKQNKTSSTSVRPIKLIKNIFEQNLPKLL